MVRFKDLPELWNTERWKLFLHSRMWLGLPAAVALAFVVHFLLGFYAEGHSATHALARAGFFALLIGFCWAIGIWASTKPDVDDEEEKSAPAWVARLQTRLPQPLTSILVLILIFAVLCLSEIIHMADGTITIARGLSGVVLKAMAIAAVVFPIAITHNRR